MPPPASSAPENRVVAAGKLLGLKTARMLVVTMAETLEQPDVSARLLGLWRGDPAAAAWLYDTFAPRLFRRLRLRYGYLGESVAEDLLQETYVLALREDARLLRQSLNLDTVTEQAVERFLWDQACGLASNRRRAAKRQFVPIEGEPVARAHGPEHRVVERDLLRRLLTCLGGRGRRPLLYFKLRYREGLTPEEIAAATGWSRKATYKARQNLNDALQWCRETLGLA